MQHRSYMLDFLMSIDTFKIFILRDHKLVAIDVITDENILETSLLEFHPKMLAQCINISHGHKTLWVILAFGKSPKCFMAKPANLDGSLSWVIKLALFMCFFPCFVLFTDTRYHINW